MNCAWCDLLYMNKDAHVLLCCVKKRELQNHILECTF